MSSFIPSVIAQTEKAPDPTKHVNFTLGMVLGVDEFVQEFAYHSNRDQWLARDLLGYGTVSGLEVSLGSHPEKGASIDVAPGSALSPAGQLICVGEAQCAYLKSWVTSKKVKDELAARITSLPPGQITVYLTLCYRDCPVDMVPAPGEPCRTEKEDDPSLLRPSRLQDDFQLELRWAPPEQMEEKAVRDFIAWLRQIELTEALPADPQADLENFAEAVRLAAQQWLSPPASPPDSSSDFMSGSPPTDLKIPGEQACDYLRLAFRIWTTELRPHWRGKGAAACLAPDEDCVHLASVTIPIIPSGESGWSLDGTREILVDQDQRPFLIHLRMLQEWLTCGRGALLTPSDHVVEETAFDLPPYAGHSELYSRGDHTHGTPDDPIPPHVADPNAHALVGDVNGVVGDNTVTSLQGTPLVASSPVSLDPGEVLTLRSSEDGLEWRPEPIPDLAGEVTGNIRRTRVARLQGQPVRFPRGMRFNDGQVLTLKTVPRPRPHLQWEAADLPEITLDGDVHGAVDENQIQNLQGKMVDAAEPQPGQFLKFVDAEPDPGPPARWVPADLPEIEIPNLIGDVSGAVGENRIQSLQGQPVDAANPQPEQYLKFVDADPANGLPARWVPATLPDSGGADNLDGDVVGAADQNHIARLQGQLVDANKPREGQILQFLSPDDGELRWVAVDPAFVTRPREAGPFGIVAAGVCDFKLDSSNPSSAGIINPYHDLQVIGDPQTFDLGGEITLTFTDYQFSGDFPPYIVKLTPWIDIDGLPFMVYFASFTDQGFIIRCQVADKLDVLLGRIMIEVSEYTPDGGR